MKVKKSYFENPQRDTSHDADIKAYLVARPGEGVPYGRIAKALGLEWHVVLHALQAMVLNDPDVIDYWPLARTPGAKISDDDRKKRLFSHAPDRKIIDLQPWRTDEVVTRVLTALLAEGPMSKRVIYRAMRDRLMHIDERIVDRCMAAMPLARLGVSKSSTRYALQEVSNSTPEDGPES